ncbi:MAG: heme-binding protein [Planctomycetota bacterium]|nr:heme-binding protein [Planctomycetota bacterium]
MKRIFRFIYLSIIMFVQMFISYPTYAFENPTQTLEAANLRTAIDEANKIKDPKQRLDLLKAASDKILASCKDNMMVIDILSKATKDVSKIEDIAKQADTLRAGLLEALVILTFKPKVEAPVPAGFPAPTPVGVVEIKKLPVYRMAKVNNTGGGNNFFTLFNHIKKNNIEMTAPVEMTMAEKNGKYTESSMAFLYQETTLGKVGPQGNIAVLDTKECMVASIGMQGSPTAEAIESAKRWLIEKIKTAPEAYEIEGELKVMGYNSPFMPEKLRYYEVQLQLKLPTK